MGTPCPYAKNLLPLGRRPTGTSLMDAEDSAITQHPYGFHCVGKFWVMTSRVLGLIAVCRFGLLNPFHRRSAIAFASAKSIELSPFVSSRRRNVCIRSGNSAAETMPSLFLSNRITRLTSRFTYSVFGDGLLLAIRVARWRTSLAFLT